MTYASPHKFRRQPALSVGLAVAGCLHELFEAQVDARPSADALICDGEVLSYAKLEARANQMARYLRSCGAGPGTFVGLYCDRSSLPIVAILACLKAGATYVPIDPSYPMDRIRHILLESEAILLLTERAFLSRAAEVFAGQIIALDGAEAEAAVSWQRSTRLLRQETGVNPKNLCYVIYTSGTTGRPKGVMTEHGSAVRFVHAFNEVCGTDPEDRVYQGFSLSFDGSVEEIWMAFSNGSALVVGNRQTPKFGNELGQFLAESGVTYFSTVPTMLSTITQSIASLRLLVVSGEVCPKELVSRWARSGLRMLNVYGPTEATVNTTSAECIPGQPITIGRPLPRYEIHILDSDLHPVERGEKGELFVGGETLARGYLKQPALTAERFVNLRIGGATATQRLYRTGDLVRLNEEGELEFFGRIDSQVKLRGYRVELAEIEALLLEHEQIRSASVKLVEREGLQELAAYVMLKDGAPPLELGQVLTRLESRLPPYMIPSHLDVLDEVPLLASGKVDRGALPVPKTPLVRVGKKIVEPHTALEAKIAAIWAQMWGMHQVSVEDDFFHDLGGHSLIAAQMVTILRQEISKDVTIRDVYKHPTVKKLATHIASLIERANIPERPDRGLPLSSRAVFERLPRLTRYATIVLQTLSTYFLYGIAAIPFGLLFLAARKWSAGKIATLELGKLVMALALLVWPVLLLLSIASKWLIVGRYRPGRYPLWSFAYFRFWLVGRIQAMSGAGALAGTPLLPLYFRLMGAKVGSGCTLDTSACAIWDLITIGDDTSIGADTQLLGYRVENGMLILGRIEIGSRCFIGIHSALGLNVRMGDDSRLDDQSLLPDQHVMSAGEARRGSPALPAEVLVPELPNGQVPKRRPILFGIAQLVLINVFALIFLVAALPLLGASYYALIAPRGSEMALRAAWLLGVVPANVIFACLLIGGLKKLVLSRARPGVYETDSVFYLRKWLSDGLMRLSRSILLPLYTTLYLPPWLRLLGAKIGVRAELSTVWHFSPELIDVGAESFFADGSIIGGKRFFRGRFEIGVNRIGRRSFVGNSAILPVGASLGDRCLLGVQSIPPATSSITPDGTEWLGSPSFALPYRPKVGNFDDAVTFQPTRRLYAQRAIIDGLRILIPGYIGIAVLLSGLLSLNAVLNHFGALAMLGLAPGIGLVLSLCAILVVVALKKLVMGTFVPVIRPLWSMYVWLNEMVNGAYESVMAPALVPFLGTPFVAPLLRLIGCKIGRHTYIETTLFSEFDLVEVGDYAALNLGAVIQNHLFEDRVMKSSYLKIGAECSVGNMAVVLYDSEMQQGAFLGPLSLLMKGEKLAPFGRWHGIPSIKEREPELAQLSTLALRMQPQAIANQAMAAPAA